MLKHLKAWPKHAAESIYKCRFVSFFFLTNKCRKPPSYHKCMSPDSSHWIKTLKPMIWSNSTPPTVGQSLTAGHLTDFDTSQERMKHTLEVLISLRCVYRDHRVTNSWPYWPSFRGFAPLVFGGPLSAQAVWEDMYVLRRVNKHQPGLALWWEPQKDPPWRKKSEQLSKHCQRCEQRSHRAVSLLSHTVHCPQTTSHACQAVTVPAPTFLLPSSCSHQAQLCNFQLPHIMPQYLLEDCPSQFFSCYCTLFLFSLHLLLFYGSV